MWEDFYITFSISHPATQLLKQQSKEFLNKIVETK